MVYKYIYIYNSDYIHTIGHNEFLLSATENQWTMNGELTGNQRTIYVQFTKHSQEITGKN